MLLESPPSVLEALFDEGLEAILSDDSRMVNRPPMKQKGSDGFSRVRKLSGENCATWKFMRSPHAPVPSTSSSSNRLVPRPTNATFAAVSSLHASRRR